MLKYHFDIIKDEPDKISFMVEIGRLFTRYHLGRIYKTVHDNYDNSIKCE